MLLESHSYVNGSESSTLWIRPKRLGFVVPEHDVEIARRVVEANCLLWGGLYNLIAPYSRRRGLDTDWIEIWRFHDPDIVVDCVGLGKTAMEKFQSMGQYVYRWQPEAQADFPLNISPIHSILIALNNRGGPQDFVVQPTIDKQDPMYLPLLARFGLVHETGFESVLRLSGYAPTLKYNDIVRVFDGSWNDRTSQIRDFPDWNFQRGQPGYSTPVYMTAKFVQIQPPSYGLDGGSPERPQYDEAYAEEVIVTGHAGSVADLCLFWALRQQRPYPAFPLWIPLEVLSTAEAKAAIEVIRHRTDPECGRTTRRRSYHPTRSLFLAAFQSWLSGTDCAHVRTGKYQLSSSRVTGLSRVQPARFSSGRNGDAELPPSTSRGDESPSPRNQCNAGVCEWCGVGP